MDDITNELNKDMKELFADKTDINDDLKANKEQILQLKEEEDNTYYEITDLVVKLKEGYKNIKEFYNYVNSRDEYKKLMEGYEYLLKNRENDYTYEIDYALIDDRIFDLEKSLTILNLNKLEYDNSLLVNPYKLKSEIRRKSEDLKSDIIDNIFNSISNNPDLINKVKKKYGIKNIANVFNKIISDTFKEFDELTPKDYRRPVDNNILRMEGIILNIISSCLRISLIDQAMSDSILRIDRNGDIILNKVLKDIKTSQNEFERIDKEISKKTKSLLLLEEREKEYTDKIKFLEEKISNREDKLKELENVTISKNIINESLNSDDKPVFNNEESESESDSDSGTEKGDDQ